MRTAVWLESVFMHHRVQSHYNDSVIRHSQAQWSAVMA